MTREDILLYDSPDFDLFEAVQEQLHVRIHFHPKILFSTANEANIIVAQLLPKQNYL